MHEPSKHSVVERLKQKLAINNPKQMINLVSELLQYVYYELKI